MVDKLITVMTRNAYFGMDVSPVLSATDPADLIAAFAMAWEQVQSTNIPERAECIAGEIAIAKPDLIGLQEVAQFFVAAGGKTSTKFDFLELIVQALTKHGISYVPLTIKNDLDHTVPVDMKGTFVRIVDRHAILLRVGESTPQVRPYHIQDKTFSTLFQVSNALAGKVSIPRSWIATDAELEGKHFRLIETHLESLSATVQMAQAEELLGGPAKADCPVIMIGDFNSNPVAGAQDSSPTYPAVLAAGFEDAWMALLAGTPGDTCCHQPSLMNPEPKLSRRIDFVFTRGQVKPVRVKLVGGQPADRTRSGLWPSDHAGLVATLELS